MIPVLAWKPAPDTAVYALKRYVPRMATLRQMKKGSQTRAENDYAYSFKTAGKHAEEVEHCLRRMADQLGCTGILAVPPSSVDGQPNACQRIFGVTIRRTRDAAPRKYNHGKPIPDGYEETYAIEHVAGEGKYLLVDDICTTGKTLLHYKAAVEALGAAVEMAAVGIHHKRKLTLADFALEPMAADTGTIFPSLMAALKYLQDQGYAVQKSKLYKDRKDGLIRMEPDGRQVRESEIHSYVVKAGLRKSTGPDPEEMEEHAALKLKAELRKIEEQTKSIIFDRSVKEGKYVLKEAAVRERVDMLTVMEVHFRQIVDVNMVKWCQVLHGDQARVNDAVDLAGADIDEMMNALARSDTFEIEYTPTEKEA